MRLHDVFHNLSQNLTLDENLLSARERELLASIWHHASQFAHGNGKESERLETILTYALGETILQRLTCSVGSQALEMIKRESIARHSATLSPLREVASPPPAPATGPRPPSPSPGPGPGMNLINRAYKPGTPSPPSPTPAPTPRPPVQDPLGPLPPSAPGPGHLDVARVSSRSAVSVAEQPEVLRAGYVSLDEFLSPEDLQNLTRFVLAHEAQFQISEVISPGVASGVIDPEYRRSRVLMDLGRLEDVLISRVQAAVPRALEKLGMQPFSAARVECQITASNHGDFFRQHSDNAEEEIATRELTFVYFFHREPKTFEGGELRIYDAYRENGRWFSSGDYQTIVPEQNQLIFFPSSLLHEITPVVCPSQAFADSRFTVNGWLHR
jgi:Rps23 Pro-64 3,4-dihydroxylase Tpa1-like proline 4-hydroxylase